MPHIALSDAAVRGITDGARLKTILEYAEERGLATGVVSNSSVLWDASARKR